MVAEIRLTHRTFQTILQELRGGKTLSISVHATLSGSRAFLTECGAAPYELSLSPSPGSERGLALRIHEGSWELSPLFWEGHRYEIARIVLVEARRGISILPLHLPESVFPGRVARALPPHLPELVSKLRIMVVGTSRTGSHIAWALLRLRPEKLILVDPDVWEAHHRDVPALALGDSMMGRLKAVSLAEALEALAGEEGSPTQVVPVPRAIWDVPVDVLAEADIIVSAVDNLPARLYLDVVAESFRALLLDVGVEADTEAWGGAVRVFWPEGSRLRTVLPVGIRDWIALCAQMRGEALPGTSGEHGALPGIAQITAGMAQLALLQALRGGLGGGEFRWSWDTVTWTWRPWREQEGRSPYVGRGVQGLVAFRQWLEEMYG